MPQPDFDMFKFQTQRTCMFEIQTFYALERFPGQLGLSVGADYPSFTLRESLEKTCGVPTFRHH